MDNLIVCVQVNGILGGLVGVTAACAVVGVWEALFIGYTHCTALATNI